MSPTPQQGTGSAAPSPPPLEMIFKGFENPDWFHCLKLTAFKCARSDGVLMVRMIVKGKFVGSNPIHDRCADVFQIELRFKTRVSVLRWLAVISDCIGTRVEQNSRCFGRIQYIHEHRNFDHSPRIAHLRWLPELEIHYVGLCNSYIIIIIS